MLKPVCLFLSLFLHCPAVSETNLSFAAKLITYNVQTRALLEVNNVDFEILRLSFSFCLQ